MVKTSKHFFAISIIVILLSIIGSTLFALYKFPAYASSTGVIGYLDPLDSSHNWCAQVTGWACDVSDPSKPVQVDLYIPDAYAPGKHAVAIVQANIPSRDEGAIAQICGTNTGNKKSYPHRFVFSFPNQFRTNKSVGVYVYGHTLNGKSTDLLNKSGTKVTCSPSSGTTNINLVLGLPGIGFDGSAPQHTTRPVTVELYAPTVQNPGSAGTNPLKTAQGVVTYDNGTDNNAGYFVSNTPIDFSSLSPGKYQILVKMPRYLYKLAINPASTSTQDQYVFTLNAGSTTTVPTMILSAGDVAVNSGQLNHLNVFDYNVFLSCFGGNSSCPVSSAGPDNTNLADLNDDGNVDIVDMNIWLRSLNALNTANALGCDSADCQGD